MTAILRQKCCKDRYGYPKCPDGACDPCDDCDDPWEGGCVSTSQSGKKIYEVIYNGPASGYPDFTGSAPCIYVLQLLGEYGEHIGDPDFFSDENFKKNYVDVGPCPGACYGPIGMCLKLPGDWVIYYVEWNGKARDAKIKDDTPAHYHSVFEDIQRRFQPNECVSILMDVEYTGSEDGRYRYAESDEELNNYEYVECPPPNDCPEYRCLEFTDGGPNHGRHVEVVLSNRFDGEGRDYDCGYAITPIDGKGPLDEMDPNYSQVEEGWWIDNGQWDGGYNHCCEDSGFVKYEGKNGEPLDTVYLHYVAGEADIVDNKQKLTAQKFVWHYDGCFYLKEGEEPPAEGLPDEYIRGASQATFKVFWKDPHPNIGLREYKIVNPHPHKAPDDHAIIFGWQPADFEGDPWKWYRWGGRMLILSEEQNMRTVNIQETPNLPEKWKRLISPDRSSLEEEVILSLNESLERLLVGVNVEEEYTGTEFTPPLYGIYYSGKGELDVYIKTLEERYPARNALVGITLEVFTHESIHALQDNSVGVLGDWQRAPIGLAITPEGIAQARGRQGIYELEVEAYSNDDGVIDSIDIVDLIRNEIANYYEY